MVKAQTRAEAYLSLSRFLSKFECGHTYANFYNQSESVSAELFDVLRLLPFQFRWLGGNMLVLTNQTSEPRLNRGAEVLSINGRSTARIQKTLLAFARADGANDAKRRALLEVRGFDRYETFDIFYGLFYRPESTVRLRVRSPGSERAESVEVETIDLAKRRSAMVTSQSDDGPLWRLTYPRPQTALLTMPNWVVYNSSWDWRGYLDSIFAEMKAQNTSKLIVDQRGNEGGNDCGDDIIARLIDAPIARERAARRVRYRQTPQRLNPFLDTWDNSFRDWGADAVARDDGFFDLRGETDSNLIEPKGPRFTGELDVLIDSHNSSATFQFASCIRTNRLGRLIGTPTGGNQRGINGGAFFFLRLPQSGLEVDLPLIARFPLTPQPNAGILPDVPISLTREEIASGQDAALEFALQ